jgi:hypothetical protein
MHQLLGRLCCDRGLFDSRIRVLVALFAVSIFLGSSLTGLAAEPVGRVSKVLNDAQIDGAMAVAGTPVHTNDRLRTGANARLQVIFRDNSVLTLGENANVVVDRFVYNPGQSKGEVMLDATQGAFRFVGGKIEQVRQKNVVVNTPHAALAVRGTHFWAGPIRGKYGVLLLKGKVRVSKR